MIPLGVLASARVAAGGWTPAGLSLFAWYDASDASTLTLSGSLVTAWADKSPAGRHLIPSASPPTRTPAAQNGRDVVTFPGRLTPGTFTVTDSWTIAAVVTPPSSSGYLWQLNGGWQHALISGYGQAFEFYESPRFTIASSAAGFHVVTITRSGGVCSATLDGAPAGGGAGQRLTGPADLIIGGSLFGDSSPSSMGELVYSSAALDSADLHGLNSYLATKWGTP